MRIRGLLISVLVFLLLSALTALVWKQQIRNQQYLLQRHVEDITIQTTRRLQIFVESRLGIASIFAERWATHETSNFSRQRFEEFASVVLGKIPGYFAIALMPHDKDDPWIVPKRAVSTSHLLKREHDRILENVRGSNETLLFGPYKSSNGETTFFAVVPLVRESVSLGYLAVDFHTENLIESCFNTRIRSEFNFVIEDGHQTLFKSGNQASLSSASGSMMRSSIKFPIGNRVWRLTMTPKKADVPAFEWTADLSVPLLGLAFSIGLSVLVFLLFFRIALYQAARDKALMEVEERKKAENALSASEARYRDVFDSATDGLLVLNQDGVVVDANRSAGRIRGSEYLELIGQKIQDLLAPHREDLFWQIMEQLEKRGIAKVDSSQLRSDGSEVELEVISTFLQRDDERKILVILSDITERKRAIGRHKMLSQKAIAAQEEERARLSMELHDELGQILTAIRLEMGLVERQIADKKGDCLKVIANLPRLVETATDELRRLCKGLRPPLLDDLGLEPAVKMLVDEFQERSNISVDLELPGYDTRMPVPGALSLCAYRIIQESLTNIRKHSQATTVDISLVQEEGWLKLSVYDNGVGFEEVAFGALQGYGLEGMRERASLVDGTVTISSLPGQGTRVVFRAPFNEEENEEA